jgi:hypothetical protein
MTTTVPGNADLIRPVVRLEIFADRDTAIESVRAARVEDRDTQR